MTKQLNSFSLAMIGIAVLFSSLSLYLSVVSIKNTILSIEMIDDNRIAQESIISLMKRIVDAEIGATNSLRHYYND